MSIQSALTKEHYEPSQCVFLSNPKQAAAYMSHDAMPVDVMVDRGSMIFVFTKASTRELYKRWKAHELEI